MNDDARLTGGKLYVAGEKLSVADSLYYSTRIITKMRINKTKIYYYCIKISVTKMIGCMKKICLVDCAESNSERKFTKYMRYTHSSKSCVLLNYFKIIYFILKYYEHKLKGNK